MKRNLLMFCIVSLALSSCWGGRFVFAADGQTLASPVFGSPAATPTRLSDGSKPSPLKLTNEIQRPPMGTFTTSPGYVSVGTGTAGNAMAYITPPATFTQNPHGEWRNYMISIPLGNGKWAEYACTRTDGMGSAVCKEIKK